jgi:hypothetical protein
MEASNDKEIEGLNPESNIANRNQHPAVVQSSGNSFWKHQPENLCYLKQQLIDKPVPQVKFDRKKGLFTIQVRSFECRSTTPSDRRF